MQLKIAESYMNKIGIQVCTEEGERNIDQSRTLYYERVWDCYEISIIYYILSQVEDIDGLNPIHIAGTKGKVSKYTYIYVLSHVNVKGSVSALSESILRAKGYKTGFFRYWYVL